MSQTRVRRPSLVGLLGVVLVVTSCSVGPNYVRPPVITPPAYKEAEGWRVAQPRDDVLRGAWWESFRDPELDALEVQVNVSNQSLAAAEATYRQAVALVGQARAAYFPTVTAGVGYARTRASATGIASSLSGVPPGTPTSVGAGSNFFQLPVDATWAPDFWGRVRRAVESSRAAAQASAGDAETARLSLQAELAQDFQLRTLDAQKQLLDATVADYEKRSS
ncbi:MAG TPA: TolC family protein [Candidatus Methylomirabilis sp.]|nr:TolC family protein [Candidatus Methylomirabilis sp.]